MKHPLEGFVLKMNRAELHLRAIKSAVEELRYVDFYTIVTQPDYKRRPTATFRNVKALDPEFSVMVGDCVHNFRSALDHLAFQLADGHSRPISKRLVKSSAFPIFASGPNYRRRGSSGAAWKMRGMSRFARGAIERSQPYHRRKHPDLWRLWQLDELWQVDKHRTIHLCAAVPQKARISINDLQGVGTFGLQQYAAPIKEGAKLARVLGDFPDPARVKVEAEISPDVIFDLDSEARSVRGHPVIDTLNAVREVILFRIITELDAEIHRLFPNLRLRVQINETPPNAC